jgi:hypothetical protein
VILQIKIIYLFPSNNPGKHSDDVKVVTNVIDNSIIKQPFVSNKPKEGIRRR